MAIDKHFRVKNGIKVGDVEVVTSEGKIPASIVYVSNVTLTSKLGSVDITLSSLSAALGSYTDAVSVLNLIETTQASASASLSTILILQNSVSSSESASQLAQSNAENHASDANLARQSASAAKVTAEGHAQSASAARSTLLVVQAEVDNIKDSVSATKSAALVLALSASASFVSTESARQAAENAAGTAESEQASALAHARSAIFAASSALSAFLSAEASSSSAESARAAAEILQGAATAASVSAGLAAASAITQKGLAINAQVAASAAASAAQVAQGLALIYSEDSVNSRVTASSAAVTAQQKETLAAEASANSSTAADAANLSASAAKSASEAALASQSSAKSSFAAASNFADKSASAATSANSSAATAESQRGLAATAASNSASSFSAANSAALAAADSASSALLSQSSAKSAADAALVSQSSAKSSFAAASNFADSSASAMQSASGSAAAAEESRILAVSAEGNSASSYSAALSAANAAKGSASSARLSVSSAKSAFAAASNFAEDSASAMQSASSSAATAESKRSLAAVAAANSSSSLSAANSAANAAKDSLSAANSASEASRLSQSSAQSSFAAADVFANDSAEAASSASSSAASAQSDAGLAATAASNSASSFSAANSAALASRGSASSAQSSFAVAEILATQAASAATTANSARASAVDAKNLAVTAQAQAAEAKSLSITNTLNPFFEFGKEGWQTLSSVTGASVYSSSSLFATASAVTGGFTANAAFKTGPDTQWIITKRKIPIDSSRKYKVTFRVRAVKDHAAPNLFVSRVLGGVLMYDVDGEELSGLTRTGIATSGLAQLTATAPDASSATSFTTYTGTITGEGFSNSSFVAGTHAVTPVFVTQYQGAGDSGVVSTADYCIVDELSLEDITVVDQAQSSAAAASISETNAIDAKNTASSAAASATSSKELSANSEAAAAASASAANSSRGAALISETNAASSESSASSNAASAVTNKLLSASSATAALNAKTSASANAVTASAARAATVELSLNPYFEFGMDGWRRTENEGSTLNANIVVVDDSDATTGKALKSNITDSTGWITTKRKIPIDISRIYEVRFRVRVVGSGSDSTNIYAGVSSYDADGNNLVGSESPGNHRYGVLNNVSITQSSEYVTYTGLFTGEGSGSTNKFKTGTKFASPMMIPYRSGATADYTLVDELSIADVTNRELAKDSASAANSSRAAASISETNAALSESNASSSNASALVSRQLSASSQAQSAASASAAFLSEIIIATPTTISEQIDAWSIDGMSANLRPSDSRLIPTGFSLGSYSWDEVAFGDPLEKVVTAVTLVNPGSGYTTPPAITFSGGSGSGATASAILASDGSVDRVEIRNQGRFYKDNTDSNSAALTVSIAGNASVQQYPTLKGTGIDPVSGVRGLVSFLQQSIGPTKSFVYVPDSVYLVKAVLRYSPSDSLGGGDSTRATIGISSRDQNGLLLYRNLDNHEKVIHKNDNYVEFNGIFHGETYSYGGLEDLPLIQQYDTSNCSTQLAYRLRTTQQNQNNNGSSTPATSATFHVRSGGGDQNIIIKSFEVVDLTQAVRSTRPSASAQASADRAFSSAGAAEISATEAANSESTASSSAASAFENKELSASSATFARESASAANSSRAAASISETNSAASESSASSSAATAFTAKEISVSARGVAETSASAAESARAAADFAATVAVEAKLSASSAKATVIEAKDISVSAQSLASSAAGAAIIAETNSVQAQGFAEAARNTAITQKNLSASSATLSNSAATIAVEQSAEAQNLGRTGGFIGKSTFDDGDGGRWSKSAVLISGEGISAHPLGRTHALKHNTRDAVYAALNGDSADYYTMSPHGKTFRIKGYVYNKNSSGPGQDAVHCNIGIRSNNGSSNVHPTVRAANFGTQQWTYFDKLLTVDDSDSQRFKPFLQNAGFTSDNDTLLSYWTDLTLEDVTATESAKAAASSAESARAAAAISESNAASSATSADEASAAASESKRLAASARLAADKGASSAESARAAASIIQGAVSQAKVDAESAESNAAISQGLSANSETAAQSAADTALGTATASAAKDLVRFWNPYVPSDGTRGWRLLSDPLGTDTVASTNPNTGSRVFRVSDGARELPANYNFYIGQKLRIRLWYNTQDCTHDHSVKIRDLNGTNRQTMFSLPHSQDWTEVDTIVTITSSTTVAQPGSPAFDISSGVGPACSDLSWIDVTESENAADSASSAQSSFGAADIARSAAVNAKTTASSASVSANEAKVLAVNAKTGAETAANGAQAAQAAALISEGNSVNAQTTATQAAASASSSKVLAASAAGAADAFAQSAFSSEQSASSFADQLSGELTTAVRDVNRISAEVQTGVDGHYAFRNQYTGRVGTGHAGKHIRYGTSLTTIDYASVVVNSENNDFGYSALGFGSVYNAPSWSATGGTLQGSTVQGLFTQTSGNMAIFERTVTGFTANSTYFFTNDFASLGASSGYDIKILDANGNEVALESGYYKNNSADASVPNHIRFTCTTTSVTIQVRVIGSVTLKNFFLTQTLDPVPVQETSTNQFPGTTEDSQGFSRIKREKDSVTRFQNPEGASAVFGDQSIAAIPENFSGKLMGLSWAGRNVSTATDETFEDTKIYIYSPYADTTVKLYMHVTSPAHSGEDITLMQGVTPPSATLNLKRQELLKLNLKDITTVDRLSGYSKEKLTLVLESTSNVLGYMYDDDHSGEVGEGKYYTPFVPLTNASAIYPSNLAQGSSSIKLDYPRFVTGGGINLASLEQLLESEAGGTLSSQAPTLSGILNQTRPDGKKFGDLTNDNNITALDADEVEKYRLGLLNDNNYHYKVPRLYKLINKLDENYDTLETTFTHNGQTYTLYNDAPLKDKTVTVNADTATTITSSNERLFIGASINNNLSNVAAMPVSGLSDFYRAAGVYQITVSAAEPCIVDVESYDSNYNTTSTSLDFSDASLTTPKTQTVDFSSSRVVIVKGDAPFSLLTRGATGIHAERYGIRQTKAAQDSGATAIAKRVTETSSTVNEFTTTITETAQSINGLEGQYSVKINNNGSISGFGISSTGVNSASSAFIVQADRFSIVNPQDYSEGLTTNPSPESIPFEIRSGTALIKKAFIANLNAGNIDVGGLTGGNISASSVIAVYKTNDKENTYAALDGSDPVYRFYVGNPNPALARFAVTSSGDVRARSLTFNGVSGNYFSSESGLGQAALNEISTFVNNNRRAITDSSVVYGDPTTSSASSYASLSFTRNTDLYQKFRLDAADISFRKEVEHYSLIDHPLKAIFDASNGNSQTLSVANLTKPESALDSEGNPSYTYVPGQLNRAMQIGEVIQISWGSINLPQNSEISGAGFVDADTGSSLNGVTIGTGTKYDTSVTIRISATTPKPTVTITRPSQGDLVWNPVYNAVATPDVVAQARAQIPSRIYLTPQRVRGAGNFASFMDDASGYNASTGALELEAIEAEDSFTSLQTQYRVVTSPVSVGYGFIASTASIDITPTIETGIVDSEGFLTAHTTILQTDEGSSLDNGGVITYGTTHYGLKVQFYSTFPTLLTGDHLTAATRIIESDGFVQYEEDYVHPVSKILLEQTGQPNIKAVIRPQICYQADSNGNANMAAYGLNFSGGAYTTIATDFADHNPTVADSSKQSQVIILGNVSEDNTGSAADNFFVVASRPDINSGDYDPKMMLRSTGELYIKNGNVSGLEKVASVTSVNSSVNSLSSRLTSGLLIPMSANELRFGQDGSLLYSNGGASLDINLRHLAGSSTSPNKLRIRYAQTNKFTFEGASGNLTAAGNITAFSDERLKSDIKTLDGKKALSMRGVEFTKDGEKSSGVIAQELEKIAPELVLSTGEYKSVAYGNLVGYLIEAVKSQQTEIDRLTFIVKEMCRGASIDWPD